MLELFLREPLGLVVSASRRDVLRLAAAGAVSLFAPGCPRPAGRASRRTIGGRIHGQDPGLGHLLREGGVPKPAGTRDEDVLVVGAGVAGLACAWRLRREGAPALLIDAGRTPGGNARSGQNQVSAFPWGAHYLRAPTREHPELEAFLEEAGLIRGRDAEGRIDWDTRAVCAAPQERLFEGGLWTSSLFPPPRSGGEAAKAALTAFEVLVDALAERRDAEGRRAFTIPLEASSRDPDLLALDEISFEAWLDREGLTDPALRWFLEYACRDDYGCTLRTTSAWAGLHDFASRRSASNDRDVTLTWPEGNGRLVRLLADAHGGCSFLGRRLCARIVPGETPDQRSEAWVYDAESKTSLRVHAQHLVFAGPQYVLAHLLPEAPAHVAAFTYGSWLVANVTLDESPRGAGAPLAWDNVFYESESLGYVVANRDARPGAACVVTWYLPLVGADPAIERKRLLDMDHADVVREVTTDLLTAHPSLAGRIQSVDAWRWGHAMIRPTPGFLWGQHRQAALVREDALLCANSDLSGIPVFEEAFYRGVVAGEEVLRRKGVTFESLL